MKTSAQPWRDGLALAAILLAAAAVRSYAWLQTAVVFNDGPVFLGMAEAISEGRWAEVLAHPYHPLYPALVALVGHAPVELETAAIVVSIAGGLVSVVGVFLFVREAFSRELAWLSAWTVALHPWAVDFSSDVMSDGLYAGLYLLGFAAMASLVRRPRPSAGLACGLAAGLAYLVRPEGLGLLVVCALLLLARGVRQADERRRIAASLAAVALAAAVVASPFMLAIAQQTGELTLTRKKTLSGLAAGRVEVDLSRPRSGEPGAETTREGEIGIPLPRSSVRADGQGAARPPRTLAGLLSAVSLAVRTSLAALRYEIVAFAALGIWAMRSQVRREREATVALPALLYTGVLILLVWGAGYVARRHALAALLPICAYAAIGWRQLCSAAIDAALGENDEARRRWKTPGVVCTLLVLTLCVVWGARDLRERRPERIPVRLAAEWLAGQADASGPVAAQKLRVAYYADAPFVPLPSGIETPIETDLRAQGVRWVVIDEARLDDHSGLSAGVGDWLTPVHAVEQAGRRALVLELRPDPAI